MRLFSSRRGLWIQVVLVLGLLAGLALLVNNLAVNLIRTGLGLSFSWLSRPAGFALGESALPVSYTHLTLPTICSV